MTYIKIKTSKTYGTYLSRHLQKEHPKTKGQVTIVYDKGTGITHKKYIDYCELCGRKMQKTRVKPRQVNICRKCLESELRTARRDIERDIKYGWSN